MRCNVPCDHNDAPEACALSTHFGCSGQLCTCLMKSSTNQTWVSSLFSSPANFFWNCSTGRFDHSDQTRHHFSRRQLTNNIALITQSTLNVTHLPDLPQRSGSTSSVSPVTCTRCRVIVHHASHRIRYNYSRLTCAPCKHFHR